MGNPFVHFELNTDDMGAAQKFYKGLFAWKFKAATGMPYTMIDFGSKDSGGGIQKKPMPEAPNAWLSYVQVDSVKKTLAKAEKAGARVVVPYMPIGAMGAIGIFMDPWGAALGVWESAPKTPAAKKGAKKGVKKGAKKKGKR